MSMPIITSTISISVSVKAGALRFSFLKKERFITVSVWFLPVAKIKKGSKH
jgi:hypothetical protein